MSVNITKLMTDDLRFTQQLRCRKFCASHRNCLYVWSSIWGNGNEFSWNPNSNTLDSDLLQDDHPASGVIAQHILSSSSSHCTFIPTRKKFGERLKKMLLFLVFRDVRKIATISAVISLRPSVRLPACPPVRSHGTARPPMDWLFSETWYLE